MQKMRMGHRAKFRDKNKCFVHVLFPVCAILCGILLTSSILRARLLIKFVFNYKKFYQIIRLELELATTSLLD